jgi:transcriptional regulator with XRE-family HTH domain
MQEVSHHGHVIKAYREQAGLTQASLVAQVAECPELHALSLARQATAELWRNRPDSAAHLYEIATDIAKRAPAALRTYLAAAHAETQGTLGDERCLASLTVAHTMLKRIDTEDDELLLFLCSRGLETCASSGLASPLPTCE